MAIPIYLAMTGAEMRDNAVPNAAWMACHFSPYGTGLSNFPRRLPPGALLMLNDRTPIHDHDPVLIAAQVEDCVQRLACAGVVLDFQRPGEAQTEELTRYLCQVLPCPIAVSAMYAGAAPERAVLLPPIPLDEPAQTALASWQGRELWLEAALDGLEIILTEDGAQERPLPPWEHPGSGFREERLHCHYCAELTDRSAIFTLWRTTDDLEALLEGAGRLGITAAVGLYQQLWHWNTPSRREGV
ncbi:MAG: hypothetical protein ACI3V1_05350 [Faecousia sp.]